MFKGKKFKDVLKSSKPDIKMVQSKSPNEKGSSRFKGVSSVIKKTNIPDVTPNPSGMSRIFNPSEVSKLGVRGVITATAFDQTQSLLAIATTNGELHVYGQKQVEVVFSFDGHETIKELHFVKGVYLVAINSKDVIIVLSLYAKKILTTVFTPGKLTCVESDPSLDWILLGLQSGTVIAYNVDRDQLSDLRIENLQKLNFFTHERISPVVSIQWNPRDIGSILISYELSTVVYSLSENTIKQHFIYELPPNAPGGEYSEDISETRRPKVIQSLFHPNSLHILTVHEDNSLVFWDANTGQLIQARTAYETDIHIPQKGLQKMPPNEIPQILKVAWICQNNPEYTSLLIAYKPPSPTSDNQNFTILDFGSTPLYSITTYEQMRKYYGDPKEQKMIPMNNYADIMNFLPLPRASPYFNACHDPGLILISFQNGEVGTMTYPTGFFTNKAILLPQSLSMLRPRTTLVTGVAVPKQLWLGMMNSGRNEVGILKGGFAVKHPTRTQEVRSAILTGHSNGSVRIWDAAPSELEEVSTYETNLATILNTGTGLEVTHISFAPDTLELAASVASGDVVLFKFETNPFYNPDGKDASLEMQFRRFSLNEAKGLLVDVSSRASPMVKQGFIPSTAVHAKKGQTTALKNSSVGFVGIAFKDGSIMVVDRRGPAVIYLGNINDIPRRKGTYITFIEFVIIEYGEDGYSSILMLCGSDHGETITYKILPSGGGRFSVELIELIQSNDSAPVIYIGSYSKHTGETCLATMQKMQQLADGHSIPGYVIVSTAVDSRLMKIGRSKEAHKTFKYPVVTSSLSFIPYLGSKGDRKTAIALINLLADGEIKILSIPDLKEAKTLKCPSTLQSKFIKQTTVMENGDILSRNGVSEAVLISVVNENATGLKSKEAELSQTPTTDTLYNPSLQIPYRPQVNSLQWARGTAYTTIELLDTIFVGERLHASKYKESEIAKGTVTVNPPKKQSQRLVEQGGSYRPQDMEYKVPVRRGQKSGGYSVLKSVTRVFESNYDYLESGINDYATAVGDQMNEAVESTSKDLMKGAMGF